MPEKPLVTLMLKAWWPAIKPIPEHLKKKKLLTEWSVCWTTRIDPRAVDCQELPGSSVRTVYYSRVPQWHLPGWWILTYYLQIIGPPHCCLATICPTTVGGTVCAKIISWFWGHDGGEVKGTLEKDMGWACWQFPGQMRLIIKMDCVRMDYGPELGFWVECMYDRKPGW